MRITKAISPRGCANGACPTLLLTDAGTVIVQGAKLPPNHRESLRVPGHEDLVSIPREVFEDLLSQYRALR
jgi:hypothetical protein